MLRLLTAGYGTKRRFATIDDVANATLFLASDEASFLTGNVLEVDGERCV